MVRLKVICYETYILRAIDPGTVCNIQQSVVLAVIEPPYSERLQKPGQSSMSDATAEAQFSCPESKTAYDAESSYRKAMQAADLVLEEVKAFAL